MDNSISQITRVQRYLPHTLDTKFHAVSLYRNNHAIAFICRKYKISKASLMRWNKKFDGTKESLIDRSHKPLSPHPSSHTEEELTWIRNYIRRNPRISMIELFGKLKRNKGYSRHPCSLFRVLRKLGFYKQQKEKKKKKYKPQPYDTPKRPGVKWQMDVKYVPTSCYVGEYADKFYQYRVIDECTRERYIYHYKETKMVHPLDIFCEKLGIRHQLIRPRTPRHNGRVERSHRNDNERFYKRLSFYSYEDLIVQAKAYIKRANNIPMQTLGVLTPLEKRTQYVK